MTFHIGAICLSVKSFLHMVGMVYNRANECYTQVTLFLCCGHRLQPDTLVYLWITVVQSTACLCKDALGVI